METVRTSPLPLLASILLLGIIPLACSTNDASGDKKASTRTSDAALTDPYGRWSNVDTNISGGNTGNKPDKGGWRDDLERLLMK